MAETLLRYLGLFNYFYAIVGADDVQRHKPKPDTFLSYAELIGVPPEKCVVFEDADFGIQAAKSVKIAVVYIREL